MIRKHVGAKQQDGGDGWSNLPTILLFGKWSKGPTIPSNRKIVLRPKDTICREHQTTAHD